MPVGAGNSAGLHLQPLATPKGLLLGLLPGAQGCLVWERRGAAEAEPTAPISRLHLEAHGCAQPRQLMLL